MDYCAVLVTFPNKDEADQLSAKLVEQKLAACANRIDPVTSLFKWQNKIQNEQEVLVIYKTRSVLLQKFSDIVKANHSYDVPEIIALPIIGGSEDYMKWIKDETQSTGL